MTDRRVPEPRSLAPARELVLQEVIRVQEVDIQLRARQALGIRGDSEDLCGRLAQRGEQTSRIVFGVQRHRLPAWLAVPRLQDACEQRVYQPKHVSDRPALIMVLEPLQGAAGPVTPTKL